MDINWDYIKDAQRDIHVKTYNELTVEYRSLQVYTRGGGGGWYWTEILVGVCRWSSRNLTLF